MLNTETIQSLIDSREGISIKNDTVNDTINLKATINMLCHRSWNAENTTPSLAIYDDRIVFQNPGAFPLGMTWQDFVDDHFSIAISSYSYHVSYYISGIFFKIGKSEI